MTYTIGIDMGTGSTKAVAVTASGQVIATTQAAYPTLTPEPTYSEQAPDLIWQAFVKCISQLVGEVREHPAGIVLSSAMHSLIPVDKTGSPLMDMITWADNRSATIATRIKDSANGEAIYAETGTPIHAMSPLCKIAWLRENNAALFEQVAKFISIKEYVWFKLFNVYEADHSIASATGLFNISSLRWNSLSLLECGIKDQQLSTPVPTDHQRKGLAADVASSLSVPADTPFIIGASDGCLANIGSFAITPGTAALTIGTSGAIRVANITPTVNFKAMTFNYCLFDNLFISGGPINNGGVALKWYAQSFLKKRLDSAADYDALLGEIEQTGTGADGLIFLPFLLGERAPIWNSDSSAVFFGIRNFHTQAHFTRSVVEGISMALYSIACAMEDSGLTISRIHVSGGFVHSTIWLQILADVFNKEIFLIHDEDASALGGAYLGLKSLGIIENFDQVMPEMQTPLKPDPKKHHVYRKLFALYERLYKNLKDEMMMLSAFRP